MRRNHPLVPFRIADLSAAVAPEHVGHRHGDLGAGCNSAIEDAVHIIDEKIQSGRSITDRTGAEVMLLAGLRTEHQRRLAKPQLGVQRSFRTIHHRTNGEPKSVLVELHRSADVSNGKHRSNGAIVLSVKGVNFRSCGFPDAGARCLRSLLFGRFCTPC